MHRLTLHLELTEEKLASIEAELTRTFQQRVEAGRKRFLDSPLRTLAIWVMRISSLAAIGLAVWLVTIGGYSGFAAFAIVVSLLLLALPQRAVALIERVWRQHIARSIRKVVRAMLKNATAAVPFTAEYDFRNDLVTYYRLKSDWAEFGWSKVVWGEQVNGQSFSLFFENQFSLDACLLILHERHNELDEYLMELASLETCS